MFKHARKKRCGENMGKPPWKRSARCRVVVYIVEKKTDIHELLEMAFLKII